MATLTGSATARAAARPQTKVAAGSISSLRVRPFTRATRNVLGAQRQVVARAAEPEAASAPVEEEFSFSLSDAKKGNEYNASDVEAAMRFYEGEGDAPGDANSEFVENLFGTEDASFFDDMDNNEAYDNEFFCAGIPEAAPKSRAGGRKQDGTPEEEDSDEVAAAKEADRMRQVEEQMVLEAELQETGLDEEKETTTRIVGPAVWDWMVDVAVDDDEDVGSVSGNPRAMAANVLAALPTDDEVFADLRNATPTLQDVDAETRDTIEFLLDDFDIENEVKAVPDNVEETFNLPEFAPLADSDVAEIDALLSEDVSLPELDMSELEGIQDLEDEGRELSDEVVSQYLATLQTPPKGAALSAEELKEMMAGEPLALVDVSAEAPVTMDDVDLSEPSFDVLPASELAFEVVENTLAEVDEVEDYKQELLALRAMPDAVLEVPPEEEIEVLDQYLSASEVFIAAEEERKMALAVQVAKGELPAEVLEEDDGDFADVETELLMPDDMAELEGAADELDEEEENWQERILELTRVTKVVKGGKLMGFRCTAVVGNNNGLVGVGCQAGREVATAVKRALVDAKKNVVRVPLVGAGTVPHRVEAKFNAARCVVLPAADGTGVLAGGSIRSVLELAGVQNVLAKRIGCRSLLNNARCTVAALEQLRTFQDVAKARGVPMERLLLPSK
ncbi:hypothetical protein HYH03_017093 [Edaphochlamys debaryana]|uniref:Small ribosomal subunit protein uS5c n=1 Tax=Edaphochlamys debaryana TaxID=47281 RepID=A0A836BQS7_9CHLO|nr:hypothetical protein HYH03_017093 [Edaphochlamys debaryana]|eukprot:KAG2484074.1 hypothetical protein HYH03_017093 [Edaphochlamys debaryana]